MTWAFVRAEHSPETDLHLVVTQAEDIVRMQIVQEIDRADGACWALEPDDDEPDKLTAQSSNMSAGATSTDVRMKPNGSCAGSRQGGARRG